MTESALAETYFGWVPNSWCHPKYSIQARQKSNIAWLLEASLTYFYLNMNILQGKNYPMQKMSESSHANTYFG